MQSKLLKFGAVAFVAALAAGPGFAQTASGPGKSTSPTVGSTGNTTQVATPAGTVSHNQTGSREAYDPSQDARASKVIGSTVYNDQNQSVGTLDDILIARDNKQPVRAVISVGGFLGIGNKLVEVDYSRLQFQQNNKVVLPNASKDELNKMQSFTYYNANANTNLSNNPGPGAPGLGVPPVGNATPQPRNTVPGKS